MLTYSRLRKLCHNIAPSNIWPAVSKVCYKSAAGGCVNSTLLVKLLTAASRLQWQPFGSLSTRRLLRRRLSLSLVRLAYWRRVASCSCSYLVLDSCSGCCRRVTPDAEFFRLLCSVRTIKIVSVRVCDPAGTVETNGTLPVLHYALPLTRFPSCRVSCSCVALRCVTIQI